MDVVAPGAVEGLVKALRAWVVGIPIIHEVTSVAVRGSAIGVAPDVRGK
jgi:hypothetical protein